MKRPMDFTEFYLRSIQNEPYLIHEPCKESVPVHPTEGCAWNIIDTVIAACRHKCKTKPKEQETSRG